MNNDVKTKAHLLAELTQLRQRVAELGAVEGEDKRVEQALRESEEKLKQRNAELTALNRLPLPLANHWN